MKRKGGRPPRKAGEKSVIISIALSESEAKMLKRQAESFGGLSKFIRFVLLQYNRFLSTL